MKKLLPVLAILFFILPSVSFATALTTQQSTSLIAVVQSSPGTPASAFVPLITAFSNITVNQATSLIAVVQASLSTPASAFVNLLVSFTEDTSAAQPTTPATAVPTITIPATQNNQQTIQPVTPTTQLTPTPTPTPVTKPVLKAQIVPVNYNEPVSSAALGNMQIPVFETNTSLPKLKVKMHIYTIEHGLSFDYLQLNGMKFQKVSQNVTENNGKYATSTYDYELTTTSPVIYGDWSGSSLILSNVLYKETYPYPNFEVTLTLERVGEWVCPSNYSSCEFPQFPITNKILINPRSQ